MIHDLVMPQLAMGMSEGTVIEWSIAEGGLVERDATLVVIETEKVVTDLPCPHRGWVHHIAQPGDKLAVETLIAQVADTQEEYRQLLAGARADQAPAPLAAAPAMPDKATPRATLHAVPVPAVAPAPVASSGARVKASGLARKLADEHGIELRSLTGTGPEGRIVKRDLYQAHAGSAAQAPHAPVASAASAASAAPGAATGVRARVPMTGMRRTIAERMVKAKTTAAHTYAFFEVDLTKLEAMRATLLAREKELGGRVSMVALYAKALAVACRHVPICNATLVDDEIIVWDPVNIGIAVALPGRTDYESALVVPVVRNVERKGVQEIDREIKDLIERARAGRITAADMADGTVTLSSTGGFLAGQWCVSTPLLNQPQVLNFQPGTPVRKPVVVDDDQIVVRSVVPCGLSFDHRAMDGEPIGRFVHKLSDVLTNPELMLV